MPRFQQWRWLVARLRGRAGTGLDDVIPPEIKDDQLYAVITRVASTPGVRHMLEIGSSSGAGSTEAFIAGAIANPDEPVLHCLEVSAARHEALVMRHARRRFVRCHHASSVALEGFATRDEVERFYLSVESKLRAFPLREVLAWLEMDMQYVATRDVPINGIRMIKDETGIDAFDAVLIDGSEFTAAAELREIYGARFVLLDDICTYKNHGNFRALAEDPAYRLLEQGSQPRNGYAVFERVGSETGATEAIPLSPA